MIPNQNGFRPGSKTDWRKRLASVIRYLDDLESCLAQANSALAPQPGTPAPDFPTAVVSTLENQLSRARALIATQDRIIQELRQHIQYQDSILGTNTGGHNERCTL